MLYIRYHDDKSLQQVLAVHARTRCAHGHCYGIPATPSVRSKRVKAKLDDILPILRKTFTERFVPLTRQYLGTQPPWSDISFSELQTLHRRAFGALADKHPLVEGDKCFKLVSLTRSSELSI